MTSVAVQTIPQFARIAVDAPATLSAREYGDLTADVLEVVRNVDLWAVFGNRADDEARRESGLRVLRSSYGSPWTIDLLHVGASAAAMVTFVRALAGVYRVVAEAEKFRAETLKTQEEVRDMRDARRARQAKVRETELVLEGEELIDGALIAAGVPLHPPGAHYSKAAIFALVRIAGWKITFSVERS